LTDIDHSFTFKHINTTRSAIVGLPKWFVLSWRLWISITVEWKMSLRFWVFALVLLSQNKLQQLVSRIRQGAIFNCVLTYCNVMKRNGRTTACQLSDMKGCPSVLENALAFNIRIGIKIIYSGTKWKEAKASEWIIIIGS